MRGTQWATAGSLAGKVLRVFATLDLHEAPIQTPLVVLLEQSCRRRRSTTNTGEFVNATDNADNDFTVFAMVVGNRTTSLIGGCI